MNGRKFAAWAVLRKPPSLLVSDAQRRAFILENTGLFAPPHVPEIRLHLATDTHPIWRQSEEDLAQIGVNAPFWAFAWAGGQGLARYVLDHPDTVRGRRVLDFATGSGVVAIAAAKAGAASVLATEIDPFCKTAIAMNAAANAVDLSVSIEDMIGQPVDPDYVLAGDVFYDRDMAGAVTDWFIDLASRGTEILVGDPERYYLPKDRLDLLAEYAVPVDQELEDAEVKRTKVWRFRA